MYKTGSDFPIIIAQTGPLNGKRWMVTEDMTIGRDPDCSIVIPDRQISRYHTRLTITDEGIIVEDLASKNGTFCNGDRISEPRYVHDGDMIQLALLQQFVYLSSDSTLPIEFDQKIEENSKAGLYLDSQSRRVWINKAEIDPPLSVPQFRLLKSLVDNQGNVVSRQDLIMSIWGEKEAVGVSEQALDALIRRLRDRLAEFEAEHNFIITVRGHGLRFENLK